ncbi:MAG: OmpH family outer membrane protein [Flavobacteriales bacterium]|nr:OmpH family outer membrane protein [Flavobacteriales bacterium]
MKNTAIILLLLAVIGISANVENDTKIGYVQMELVLQNMKETKQMNLTIEKYTAEKQIELKKNSEFLNKKFEEYRQKNENQVNADRLVAEGELKGMQKALEALKLRTEQEIMAEKSALLIPIREKLEKAVDAVAKKYSYKYVFNSVDETGNSVVVVAPERDDLTEEVLQHLGIKLK